MDMVERKKLNQTRRPKFGKFYTPVACGLGLQYLLVLLDAVLAAEAFLLAVDQQEVVG